MERGLKVFSSHLLTLITIILVLHCGFCDVEARRRFRRPPPLVKVGNDIVPLAGRPKTVDIEPLLGLGSNRRNGGSIYSFYTGNHRSKTKTAQTPLFILRKRNPYSRSYKQYGQLPNWSNGLPSSVFDGNRRAYNMEEHRSPSEAKLEYYRSLLPVWYQYKLKKQAVEYAKYLRTLQLLSLAKSANAANAVSSPELSMFAQSFEHSPYSSLLNSSSYVAANSVPLGTNFTSLINSTSSDQLTEASERYDAFAHQEFTSLERELAKDRRSLLGVFPPPESEIPFGERTILMVRFPPVPHQKKKDIIKLKTEYDIDGGVTFGGRPWLSFGAPFNPYDHPWNKPVGWTKPEPTKFAQKEAEKPSSYGVIITQNFVFRPSIAFTNSDPSTLAKNQGNVLNSGPGIVAQLAKALAEGNRISNSYFLSKAALQGKTWASSEKKPPFVMIHLDTYTKKSNTSGSLGLENQEEASYANGTIIYPTVNNPHILASTKFEFHDSKELDRIFDKPLATYGDAGDGWGQVPIHPRGIREIKNFLKLMHKVHQTAHGAGKKKVVDLWKLGDQLERPAFPDSKPLLRHQIADRSTNWLHTGSVGIRSLSEDDDQFPYDKHPLIDVSKAYPSYY